VRLAGWGLVLVGVVVVLAGPDVPGGLCAAVGGVVLAVAALPALRGGSEIVVARAVLLLMFGGFVALFGLVVAASA
jgi:hypothetical protein